MVKMTKNRLMGGLLEPIKTVPRQCCARTRYIQINFRRISSKSERKGFDLSDF